MANKKFWLGMLVIVLVFGMMVLGCGGGNRLQGTWVSSYGGVITFGSNTVTWDGDTGTYSTKGNDLTLTIEGVSITGTYSIDGDILIVSFMGETETFTRRR